MCFCLFNVSYTEIDMRANICDGGYSFYWGIVGIYYRKYTKMCRKTYTALELDQILVTFRHHRFLRISFK